MANKTLQEIKANALNNPEIRKEYDALQPEYELIRAIMNERIANNLTQQELADRTGIARADISRIENGNANPSLKTIKRIANAFGKTVKIQFV